MRLFNKELSMTVSEFYNKYDLYMDIPLNVWVSKENMSDEEKKSVVGGVVGGSVVVGCCSCWW